MPTTAQDVRSRIDELPELLPFPAVALELIEACKYPRTGVSELCRIVECDPGMSLKLLQIANSSMYGCGGKIRSVEHAGVLLGAKGIGDLALSAGTSEVFSGRPDPVVAKLWRHSLGCATVARCIGEHVAELSPSEAFVTGLIHDIGKLVFLDLLADEYDLIPKALEANSTIEDEENYFGLSHAELGARCGEDWGLPGEITDAIRSHHCPGEAEFAQELASVICVANQISKLWNIGVEDVALDLEATELMAQLDVQTDEEMLTDIQERSTNDFAMSLKAFGV